MSFMPGLSGLSKFSNFALASAALVGLRKETIPLEEIQGIEGRLAKGGLSVDTVKGFAEKLLRYAEESGRHISYNTMEGALGFITQQLPGNPTEAFDYNRRMMAILARPRLPLFESREGRSRRISSLFEVGRYASSCVARFPENDHESRATSHYNIAQNLPFNSQRRNEAIGSMWIEVAAFKDRAKIVSFCAGVLEENLGIDAAERIVRLSNGTYEESPIWQGAADRMLAYTRPSKGTPSPEEDKKNLSTLVNTLYLLREVNVRPEESEPRHKLIPQVAEAALDCLSRMAAHQEPEVTARMVCGISDSLRDPDLLKAGEMVFGAFSRDSRGSTAIYLGVITRALDVSRPEGSAEFISKAEAGIRAAKSGRRPPTAASALRG
jgi:hypothetical protein